MSSLVPMAWRSVPTYAQVVDGAGEIVAVGGWLLLPDDPRPYRMVGGRALGVDPGALVPVVVPGEADALANLQHAFHVTTEGTTYQ